MYMVKKKRTFFSLGVLMGRTLGTSCTYPVSGAVAADDIFWYPIIFLMLVSPYIQLMTIQYTGQIISGSLWIFIMR